jgi:hypothetical protein
MEYQRVLISIPKQSVTRMISKMSWILEPVGFGHLKPTGIELLKPEIDRAPEDHDMDKMIP